MANAFNNAMNEVPEHSTIIIISSCKVETWHGIFLTFYNLAWVYLQKTNKVFFPGVITVLNVADTRFYLNPMHPSATQLRE